jgi:predicted small lipoprotein YifL
MKLRNIILVLLMTFSLSACGYDGHYRYPCQDPANWENAECKPPLCEATGTCTKDLVGFDPSSGVVEETPDEITSDIIEDTSDAPAPENVDKINDMVDEVSEGN